VKSDDHSAGAVPKRESQRTFIATIASRALLAKAAAGPVAAGVILQLTDGWGSVPGDALMIVAFLMFTAQTVITETVLNPRGSRWRESLWPLGLGSIYGVVFWIGWLAVDANVLAGPSLQLRVLLLLPIVPIAVWYFRMQRGPTGTK
jgi:hypothetical protein